jgi:hypothetical protein
MAPSDDRQAGHVTAPIRCAKVAPSFRGTIAVAISHGMSTCTRCFIDHAHNHQTGSKSP